MFDNTNETLNIYRTFVNIHYELGSYFLNAGTTAYETGVSVMYPMAYWTIFEPDTWDYKLWKDIFVAPMVDNTTLRDITFPTGDDWVDWWNPKKVYSGGSTIYNYSVPLSQFPVFHRKGSILPLDVKNNDGNHGDERSSDYLTLLISHLAPGAYQSVREEATGPAPTAQEFRYGYDANGMLFTFTASAHTRRLLLLISGVTVGEQATFHLKGSGITLPRMDSLHDLYSQGQGWFYQSKKGELWIIPGDSSAGMILTSAGISARA